VSRTCLNLALFVYIATTYVPFFLSDVYSNLPCTCRSYYTADQGDLMDMTSPVWSKISEQIQVCTSSAPTPE
jgi:hypothetical protein